MKIVRILYKEKPVYGVLEEGKVKILERPCYLEHPVFNGETVKAGEVKWLAPCEPSKVLCVGLNYKQHAAEVKLALPKEPLLFLKPSSAVIGPGETIRLASAARRIDYEAELGIVIGKELRNVDTAHALEYVWGYTCANDVSDRVLQQGDGQWCRAKGFDTYLPIGPCIDTEVNPFDLAISLTQNGQVKQASRTSDMIFSAAEIVSFMSGIMTLYPGDLIITGTPSGIGPMADGDRIAITIEGIGTLENQVKACV